MDISLPTWCFTKKCVRDLGQRPNLSNLPATQQQGWWTVFQCCPYMEAQFWASGYRLQKGSEAWESWALSQSSALIWLALAADGSLTSHNYHIGYEDFPHYCTEYEDFPHCCIEYENFSHCYSLIFCLYYYCRCFLICLKVCLFLQNFCLRDATFWFFSSGVESGFVVHLKVSL